MNRLAVAAIEQTDGEQSIAQKMTAEMIPQLCDESNRVDLNDMGAVKVTVGDYLRHCVEVNELPTIAGCALALGRCRHGLYKYASEHPESEFAEFLSQLSDALADLLAQASLHNKVNCVSAIFLLKNYHAFRDSVELCAPAPADDCRPSVEDIRKRYYAESEDE